MIPTNPSGLLDSTQYYFYVNGAEYSITTGISPTYNDVAQLMDAEISVAGFTVEIVGTSPTSDIRVSNTGTRGSGSFVELAPGTSGLDLFSNLTGFTTLDPSTLGGGSGVIAREVPLDVVPMIASGQSTIEVDVIPEISGTAILYGQASVGILGKIWLPTGGGNIASTDTVFEVDVEISAIGSVSFGGSSQLAIDYLVLVAGTANAAGGSLTKITISRFAIGSIVIAREVGKSILDIGAVPGAPTLATTTNDSGANVVGFGDSVTSTLYHDEKAIAFGEFGRVGFWDSLTKSWSSYNNNLSTELNDDGTNTGGNTINAAEYISFEDKIVVGSGGQIASWDSSSWSGASNTSPTVLHDDGSNVLGPLSTIKSIIEYSGNVVVGGTSGRIAYWDGFNWFNYNNTDFAELNDDNTNTTGGYDIIDFEIVLSGELLAADTNGGISMWDGSRWYSAASNSLDQNLNNDGSSILGVGNAITVIKQFGDFLMVGGAGGRLAHWNGFFWTSYNNLDPNLLTDDGTNTTGGSDITDMVVYRDHLMVASATGDISYWFKPIASTIGSWYKGSDAIDNKSLNNIAGRLCGGRINKLLNFGDGFLMAFGDGGTVAVWTGTGWYSCSVANLATFITSWQTDATGALTTTGSTQIKLPLDQDGNYNFTVDWGDGNTDVITSYNQAETTHAYGVAGTYSVGISGYCHGFGFPRSGGDNSKLIDVIQWGSVNLNNKGSQFYGCDSLTTFSATDAPWIKNISRFESAFENASSFNGDLSSWDFSGKIDTSFMFAGASSFNQSLSSWDVSDLILAEHMFDSASSFNGDISGWDTNNLRLAGHMFKDASSFNIDIGNWDTFFIQDMEGMFSGATLFNQDLSSWSVGRLPAEPIGFATGSSLTALNKPVWGTCPNTAFVSTWNSNNTGNTTTQNENIGLPLVSGGNYNFTVDWGDGNTDVITLYNQPEVIHTYEFGGQYNIKITGTIVGWNFSDSLIQDKSKLLGVRSWGPLTILNGEDAFKNCNNLIGFLEFDSPKISSTTTLRECFVGCTFFMKGARSWDVSSITNMKRVFYNLLNFNEDLSSWDVSNVTIFDEMFYSTFRFNTNLGKWDIRSATNMRYMFDESGMSADSYSETLRQWSTLIPLNTAVKFGARGLNYNSDVAFERSILINTWKWVIGDAGVV